MEDLTTKVVMEDFATSMRVEHSTATGKAKVSSKIGGSVNKWKDCL